MSSYVVGPMSTACSGSTSVFLTIVRKRASIGINATIVAGSEIGAEPRYLRSVASQPINHASGSPSPDSTDRLKSSRDSVSWDSLIVTPSSACIEWPYTFLI